MHKIIHTNKKTNAMELKSCIHPQRTCVHKIVRHRIMTVYSATSWMTQNPKTHVCDFVYTTGSTLHMSNGTMVCLVSIWGSKVTLTSLDNPRNPLSHTQMYSNADSPGISKTTIYPHSHPYVRVSQYTKVTPQTLPLKIQ